MSFLEGTAYAGYTLYKLQHPRAAVFYIKILHDRLTRPNGVFNYLNTRVCGGDWHEGVGYGVGSKMRLYSALSVIATMSGTNYFTQNRFFPDSILYAFYQLQPGNKYIYPGGDMARNSSMPVSSFERYYMQMVTYFIQNSTTRQYGQWYLENIVPSYNVDFNFLGAYYRDMIFKLSLPSMLPDTLPLMYKTTSTNWINLRSGWGADATSLSIAGDKIIDQSHAHIDAGSFVIWKQGWLAMDAGTLSHSGLVWEPGAHNMIHVDVTGSQRREIPRLGGLKRFVNTDHSSYAQIDGSKLFQYYNLNTYSWETLLNEWTREIVYIKPSTVIVYDRVSPKAGTTYNWRLHLPEQPTLSSGQYKVTANGAGLTLVPLLAGTTSVRQDTDLSDSECPAWRVQQDPDSPDGRFLNLIGVASGSAPSVTTQRIQATGTIDGAVWSNNVAVFSKQAKGAPSALPFSYTIVGTSVRTHLFYNIRGSYNISIVKQTSDTVVTVSQGTQYTASSQGFISVTQ